MMAVRARRHTQNPGPPLQAIVGPRGDILWVSGALPGSVHDKKAECERTNAQLKTWKILTKLRCCPWSAGQLTAVSVAGAVVLLGERLTPTVIAGGRSSWPG
jgi:hypothetical protein